MPSPVPSNPFRVELGLLWLALALAVGVGVLGRGFWTPDEPREADIAWRMSWQADKAVPLLAGEPFCEKPPLAYWVSAATIDLGGARAWAARLPNLLYALVTALALYSIGRRAAGRIAGWVAGAAITTFLLTYQVSIWLATDAPLLAAVALALLGLYRGFYAADGSERLRGYTLMHAALALGFLCKSAAGWMVPALTLPALVIWERRWRELLRWELYAGLGLQAALILGWVWWVYLGPDGLAHLKVFFWNNLVGRFARVDAPEEFQYAAAHRNSPGKYLLELPLYLWPWTLLVLAALRRAWRQRHATADARRAVRFSCAAFFPTLAVLSVAATARNIYLAPALPGLAVLLGWWVNELHTSAERWDLHALRVTRWLLLMGLPALILVLLLVGYDSWSALESPARYVLVSFIGLLVARGSLALVPRRIRSGQLLHALAGLLLAYCAVLVGPASQLYGRVDAWQDLASIGRAIGADSADRPIVLFAQDETTRAFIDMYARTSITWLAGPITPGAVRQLTERLEREPRALVVTQIPGSHAARTLRELGVRLGFKSSALEPDVQNEPLPSWTSAARLRLIRSYSLANGRRYGLLERDY